MMTYDLSRKCQSSSAGDSLAAPISVWIVPIKSLDDARTKWVERVLISGSYRACVEKSHGRDSIKQEITSGSNKYHQIGRQVRNATFERALVCSKHSAR